MAKEYPSKSLSGWLLVMCTLNSILLVCLIVDLGSNFSKIQSTGGSNTNSQITALQKSVDDLSSKVTAIQQAPATNQSTSSVTCSGEFYQSFSGFGSTIGSTINMNLSGTSPISLICR